MSRNRRPTSSFAWFGFVTLALCVYFTWQHFVAPASLRPSEQDSPSARWGTASDRAPGRVASPETTPETAIFSARVVAVADGDSIVVTSDHADVGISKGEIRIRLEGIDAPEFGQPFHRQSKRFLSDACNGRTVYVQPFEKDRYGRLVGRVYVREPTKSAVSLESAASFGNDLNRQLLEAGLAWHYFRYNDDAEFAAAETNARSRGIGLWQDPHPIAPWVWREQKRNE